MFLPVNLILRSISNRRLRGLLLNLRLLFSFHSRIPLNEGKIIFSVLCRQDLRPERRNGRGLESFESKHWSDSLFYPAIVLFDNFVQAQA